MKCRTRHLGGGAAETRLLVAEVLAFREDGVPRADLGEEDGDVEVIWSSENLSSNSVDLFQIPMGSK